MIDTQIWSSHYWWTVILWNHCYTFFPLFTPDSWCLKACCYDYSVDPITKIINHFNNMMWFLKDKLGASKAKNNEKIAIFVPWHSYLLGLLSGYEMEQEYFYNVNILVKWNISMEKSQIHKNTMENSLFWHELLTTKWKDLIILFYLRIIYIHGNS